MIRDATYGTRCPSVAISTADTILMQQTCPGNSAVGVAAVTASIVNARDLITAATLVSGARTPPQVTSGNPDHDDHREQWCVGGRGGVLACGPLLPPVDRLAFAWRWRVEVS